MSDTTTAPPKAQPNLSFIKARAKAVIAQRKSQINDRFKKWVSDPVGFVVNELLGFLWSKQREIVESVRDNRRTAVPSCHDVGKTYVAAVVGAWWIATHEPGQAFVVTLAPTFHQVKALLWRELNRLHAAGRLPGQMIQTEWRLGNELVAFGRSPADTDPTAVQGIHARYVLVIYDEAGGVARAIKDAGDSLIANDDSRELAIGNPDDPTTWFKEACDPGSGYNVINLDAMESPNFSGEDVPDWLRPLLIGPTWVKEKKKSWGENSPIYISKVRGQFPEQASDSLVPLADLKAAVARGLELEGQIGEGLPNELGVDVARFGGDKSVIYHRRGNVARRYWQHSKRDTMATAGAVRAALLETGAKRVKIDDIGVGGGVVDRLVEMQGNGEIPGDVEIIGVNVGEGPVDTKADERFKNLRAELNWSLRMRFVNGQIALIGETDDVISQASQIKYDFKSDQLIIESKKDMKKRTKGASPDDWDALVLCFGDPNTAANAWIEHFAQLAAKSMQAPAPVTAASESRPWQPPKAAPSPSEDANVLVKFYEDKLKESMGLSDPVCKFCKKPITTGSSTSDGVDTWHHPSCPT